MVLNPSGFNSFVVVFLSVLPFPFLSPRMAVVLPDDDDSAIGDLQDHVRDLNLDGNMDGHNLFRARQREKDAGFCSGVFRARCDGQ